MAADEQGTDSGLESALDELFGSDPNEFVATRKRLASALRAQGDAAAARRLVATRRPTKAAAALNVLARQRPALIGALLDRSAELRVAQARALAGEPGSQRDATRAQRQALTDAADATVATLAGTGEAARAEILSTLQGAAVDDELGAQLRAGRLERTEVAATGFPEDLTGGDVVPARVLAERRARKNESRTQESREPRRRPDPVAEPDREREREEERARRREEARRREADELSRAEEALRIATEDATAATAAVTDAEARVATRRAELEAARLEARAAKDRAAAATRELARRTRDVARRRR